MKIHISYKFQKGPWGGGNQFLKALKKEFEEMEVCTEDPEKAEIILFNSHHCLDKVFEVKKKFPQKIFVHRINGPVQLIRGKDKALDRIIYQFNNLVADGIVFQSNWCREQNKKLFNVLSNYETVIYNAPDNHVFNRNNKKEFNPKEKIKLITTNWSSNWRKGFRVYKFLDENLDFSKYEITFVGYSPIKFENIKLIKPVNSEILAKILKGNDIYITASQNDPCSNSLIEALSCGLPAVALNDGGHPELVQKGGKLFSRKEDVIDEIEGVVKNYKDYRSQIPEFSIKKVAKDYYDFAEKIFNDVQRGQHQLKQVNLLTKINFYKMKSMILKWRGLNKIRSIKGKL